MKFATGTPREVEIEVMRPIKEMQLQPVISIELTKSDIRALDDTSGMRYDAKAKSVLNEIQAAFQQVETEFENGQN